MDAPATIEAIQLSRLGSVILWIITGVCSVPPLVVVALKVKKVPLAPLMTSIKAEFIESIILVLWFASWQAGVRLDLEKQISVLEAAPSWAKALPSALASGILLLVAFLMLARTMGNWRQHFAALLIFWIVNLGAWFALKWNVAPKFEATIATIRTTPPVDTYKLVRASFIRDYAIGSWQYARFGSGLALTCFLALNARRGWKLEGRLSRLLRREDDGPDFGFALLVLGFVVVVEGWIWIERLSLMERLTTLDDLKLWRVVLIAPSKS
jgi:hypothetical protein